MTQSRQSHVCRAAGGISAALWLISLFLVAYETPGVVHWNDPQFILGFEVLLAGWLEMFEGHFGWSANIFLVWAILSAISGNRPRVWVVTVGLLIAVTALPPFHAGFLDDHGTNGDTYPRIGAFVWIGSFVPVILAAVVGVVIERSRTARLV